MGEQLQQHSNEMVQLMPGVFSSAVGGSNGGGQMQLIRSGSTMSASAAAALAAGQSGQMTALVPATRKRKSSQSHLGQPPATIIKAEPGKMMGFL